MGVSMITGNRLQAIAWLVDGRPHFLCHITLSANSALSFAYLVFCHVHCMHPELSCNKQWILWGKKKVFFRVTLEHTEVQPWGMNTPWCSYSKVQHMLKYNLQPYGDGLGLGWNPTEHTTTIYWNYQRDIASCFGQLALP